MKDVLRRISTSKCLRRRAGVSPRGYGLVAYNTRPTPPRLGGATPRGFHALVTRSLPLRPRPRRVGGAPEGDDGPGEAPGRVGDGGAGGPRGARPGREARGDDAGH